MTYHRWSEHLLELYPALRASQPDLTVPIGQQLRYIGRAQAHMPEYPQVHFRAMWLHDHNQLEIVAMRHDERLIRRVEKLLLMLSALGPDELIDRIKHDMGQNLG